MFLINIQKNSLKINNNNNFISYFSCFNYYNPNKKRNPGIDLVRLCGSYFIILNHLISFGKACEKFPKYQKQLKVIEILTGWHNNGFALISGIIGYKTNRYSNLIFLWLTVHFYSVGIRLFVEYFKIKFVSKNEISQDIFPIIFRRYWYFTVYFGMYLFLPVINKGISSLSKYEFKLVLMNIFGIIVFWRDFINTNIDVFNTRKGMSMIWLMILYLAGAYIGKYKTNYFGLKKYILLIIYVILYLFPSYLYIKINYNGINIGKGSVKKEIIIFLKKMLTLRYDSFLKITQSVSICLFCLQINYNKYIAQIISFFGPLAFGVYLIHFHPIVVNNVIIHIFDKDQRNLSQNSLIILILLKTLKIFIFCILIDYIRNKLFIYFRFRNIFIHLEKKLLKN